MKLVKSLVSWLMSLTLNTIDYALYLLLAVLKGGSAFPSDLQGKNKPKKSVIKKNDAKVEGESDLFVHPDFVNKQCALTPMEGVKNMADFVKKVCQKYTTRKMLGSRKLLGTLPNPQDPKLLMFEFEDDLTWQTYEQVDKRIDAIGTGIRKLTKLKSLEKFALFENTCQEWFMTAQALMRYNITMVTVYATLGDDALVAALNETESTALLVNETSLKKLESLASEIPSLKYIIYVPEKKTTDGKAAESLKSKQPQLNIYSFAEMEDAGKTDQSAAETDATLDTLAMIMYTSGTTGMPKGVMITHGNILACTASIDIALGFDKNKEHVYLGYLPLAHILEFCAEHFMINRGGCIGYGTTRTLSDRAAKPCGDLRAVRPTLMAGVPRVWETIKKGIQDIVNDPKQTNWIKKWIFETGFAAKKHALIHENRDTPMWNKLLFDKFKQQTGGRLEMMISGGAPLNKETQEFVRVCFGAPICQGYGLTETCACITVQSGFDSFATLTTGSIEPCTEVKLVSVPDMGYLVTDKNPAGEIFARGPIITKGYYKQEKKTKEDFKSDGFFATGDIGRINDDGSLSIVDRKKNLVKLDTGEYVALEKLESTYANCTFVSPNGICVYGDGFHSTLVAIVLPNLKSLFAHCKAKGYIAEDVESPSKVHWQSILSKPELQKEVLASLNSEATQAKFQKVEFLQQVTLLNDEWTPENGMLTASMKLNRNAINKKYETLIHNMYAHK